MDDGAGMRRRELARYHDIASSTKVRGEGIGFAGVGIKLGLLAVRGGADRDPPRPHHVATTLGPGLAAPGALEMGRLRRGWWPRAAPPSACGSRNALSPLLDTGFVEAVLRRHFQPLLEPGFEEILPRTTRGA